MIKFADIHLFQPLPPTHWIFVMIGDDAGRIGLGECSFSGLTAEIIASARKITTQLIGVGQHYALTTLSSNEADNAVVAAALAGVYQALCDLGARQIRRPLARKLERAAREKLSFYANINRGHC